MSRRHSMSSTSTRSPKALHAEKQEQASSSRRTRFWGITFVIAFFLLERATVFAAPTPPQFAVDVLNVPHQEVPRDEDNPALRKAGSDNPVGDNVGKTDDVVKESGSGLEGTGNDVDTGMEREVGNGAAGVAVGPNLEETSGKGGDENVEGEPANIAYFMQISETTVDHLPRLLDRLHHEKNVYAIHFDLKIPHERKKEAEERIRSNAKYARNVHIMPSELIIYRGISMLLNTINAIRLLLDVDSSWQYFINLSGSDYPLVTVENQRKLLGQKLGLNYFTFAPRRTWNKMAENRLAEVWYDEALTFRANASLGELKKLPGRNPLVDDRDFEVSHAEAWMISSRDFCDFVVRGDMARKMLVAFAYAVDSSEHYFASLAWNHEDYKKSIVPHSMRMIVWVHKGVLAGQHPYYVDEQEDNGSYRFKESLSDSVLFFARKFRNKDSKLMDYLDERSKDRDVLAKVEDHLSGKITSRQLRVSEL